MVHVNLTSDIFVVSDDPLCMLTNMANNNKAYVWTCADFSEGEQRIEK